MQIFTECNLASIVNEIIHGKTVVLPTETSYGLCCDATNQEAVDKVFKIKQRPGNKPLLVVVPTIEMAKEYLEWNDLLDKVANKFWPGELTIVGNTRPHPALPLKGEGVSDVANVVTKREETNIPLLSRRGQGVVSQQDSSNHDSRIYEFGKRLLGHIRTIQFRKELRQNKTKAENILWSNLRNKRLGGLRFRRQHGIGPFVVDFYHSESKTIIEIDGDIHFIDDNNQLKDKNRQKWFEENGYRVLRYTNVDIYNNLDWILRELYHKISELSSPCPLRCGGGGVATSNIRCLSKGVVSEQKTLALRVTAHPLLKSITEKIGRPLVATSANLSDTGEIYDPAKIIEQFKNQEWQPDIILNQGVLSVRKPTTLVSVVGGKLEILRQGEIKIEL